LPRVLSLSALSFTTAAETQTSPLCPNAAPSTLSTLIATRLGDPRVLTLVTKRVLRILYGELRNGSACIPTLEVGECLCAWGAKNGIDDFIRMKGHFELIECDFAASFDLVSSLPVIRQDERTNDGENRRGPASLSSVLKAGSGRCRLTRALRSN